MLGQLFGCRRFVLLEKRKGALCRLRLEPSRGSPIAHETSRGMLVESGWSGGRWGNFKSGQNGGHGEKSGKNGGHGEKWGKRGKMGEAGKNGKIGKTGKNGKTGKKAKSISQKT